MTDQHSLFGAKAVVRPSSGGEAGSPSALVEERQASSMSEGNRALTTDALMERICEGKNLNRAYKRVKANRGSPGVDAMTVGELGAWLAAHKEELVASLLDGSYRPRVVRGVNIPKPGGGMRQLGIPTVVDRLVQQAILQVLDPLVDPTFSESSYGFRVGRSAHQALRKASEYVAEGYAVVVDMELERRGHRFCRYADDLNVYVRSKVAGERVMASVTRFVEKRLRLRVNRTKSAVAHVSERKFLGYRLLAGGRLTIAPASLERAKDRIREITRRNRGISLERMIWELNSFLSGWVTYFRYASAKEHLRRLDEWIRRKLRCMRLKQRKRGRSVTVFLVSLGVPHRRARSLGGSGCGWWRMAGCPQAAEAMTLQWFKEQKLVSLTERYLTLQH